MKSATKMPAIRVSSKNPSQEAMRKVVARIKGENIQFKKFNQQTSQEFSLRKNSNQKVSFVEVDDQDRVKNYLEDIMKPTFNSVQQCEEQREAQKVLQKNLNNYKNLKQINEQLFSNHNIEEKSQFFTPQGSPKSLVRFKIQSSNNQHHYRVGSQNQSQLFPIDNSGYFKMRAHKKDSTDTAIYDHSKMSNNNLSMIRSNVTSQQRTYRMNEQSKLHYDQDTFLRFYNLKKSLQSQNILFKEIKEMNSAPNSPRSKIQNIQDFFVSNNLVQNSKFIRFINIGDVVVQNQTQAYSFGGKRQNFKDSLNLIQITRNPIQPLKFQMIEGVKHEIFNRYGHIAHQFQDKIIIFGGEEVHFQQTKYIRSLLSDLIMYSPKQKDYQVINFRVPIRKVRAQASFILGKYLYYYGGSTQHGEVVGELIRINLTQNTQQHFDWKLVEIKNRKLNQTPPPLMYSAICPVFYENRLSRFNGDKIEEFKIENMMKDIDWGTACNYINQEGVYLFGGLTDKNEANNDLYLLRFGENKNKRHEFIKPDVRGNPPSGRYMHSMDYYPDSNVLIVFGGRNDLQKQAILNDIHVLYLDTLTWVEAMYCSQRLKPRCNHNTLLHENQLYILGGQTDGMQASHDYEVVQLDQEKNFQEHINKFFLKKMALFIKEKFQKNASPSQQKLNLSRSSNSNSKIRLSRDRLKQQTKRHLMGEQTSIKYESKMEKAENYIKKLENQIELQQSQQELQQDNSYLHPRKHQFSIPLEYQYVPKFQALKNQNNNEFIKMKHKKSISFKV